MESIFWAASNGHVSVAKRILMKIPTLKVSCSLGDSGGTALHQACMADQDSIVSILLAHPDINVNEMTYQGYTPLLYACVNGNTSCARLLLRDQRVRVTAANFNGRTPLYQAARDGHVDIVRWWIAYGREMDLGRPKNEDMDLVGEARERGNAEVVALLERFQDQVRTRREVRVEVGWCDEAAAEMFAIVVFVSDGLLRVELKGGNSSAVGSPKDIVRARDSEPAFRKLAIPPVTSMEHYLAFLNTILDEPAAVVLPNVPFNLPTMVIAVHVGTLEEQVAAATQFRYLFSDATDNPETREAATSCGVIPKFVEFISCSHSPTLQMEAVWALGAVAELDSQCRDLGLTSGVLPPLLKLLRDPETTLEMVKRATWALRNLCGGNDPPPDWYVMIQAFPTLAFLLNSTDEEVLADACWAVLRLCGSVDFKIQEVIDSGMTRRLVELLHHPSPSVQASALKLVGNVVSGTDVQTQAIINAGGLDALADLISKKDFCTKVCWTVSNITAGSPAQIQAVIQANLIPPLIEVVGNGDPGAQKEAKWAILNAVTRGNGRQIMYLVDQGGVKPVCDALDGPNTMTIEKGLNALERMLQEGEDAGTNTVAGLIKEAGGLDKIKLLQEHENNDLSQKADSIIQHYYTES